MDDTGNRFEKWLDNAEEAFSFAETAKARFETGDLSIKREILACLGSNLTLMDRTFHVSTAKPLQLIGEIAPEVQTLHKRLEPPKIPQSQGDWEVLYASNAKWGG